MKRIPLTQGQFALVDDEDFERLSVWPWHAQWNGNTRSFYARRNSKYSKGVKRHAVFMHREILGLTQGDRSALGDHVNRDTLDNRHTNLRVATLSENIWNSGKRRNGSNPYKGVYWHSTRNCWCSAIAINGKLKHLGVFPTPELAHEAYAKAAIDHRGQFSHLWANESKGISTNVNTSGKIPPASAVGAGIGRQ